MITGSWKGRINRQKVEVKIIQSGDSLKGTSYYFESHSNYRRYSIKGYFDPETNEAVWWDDQLIEEKNSRISISTPGKIPMLSHAEFNCPGGGRMMLDGKVASKTNETKPTGEVHLDKTTEIEFEDEWDYVIDNYTVGTNDPYLIDSIAGISHTIPAVLTSPEVVPTIQEKFITREKVFVKEIPLTGDSLELRFYDNAEIDGDSISLFLNNKLLFEHIKLGAQAYSIKLPISSMEQSNELTMVAENLGAIPPNTSYMLAIAGGKRYDAYLASTEGSSAMIRFIKK